MSMRFPLDTCRGASVPPGGLAALAPLRTKGGVRVVTGEPAWVEWDGERPDVIAALRAVPGAEFFEPRAGHWFASGSHLPAFDVPPAGQGVALERAVVPAPFTPIEPGAAAHRRVPLALVRCERPRPTSAIRCPIAALQPWADSAPTAELADVRAARFGDAAWLLGKALPAITGAQRFWGKSVLIPLGLCAEPDWPESALREAAAVGPDEILVLTEEATEAIPTEAFRPLTRAAIRRASSA